jgi:hypothetical protein
MDRKKFFDTIRAQPDNMFPDTFTQETVVGITGVLNAFATHGDGDKRTLAYALATTRGEVGQDMLPVREGFTRSDGAARRAVLALAKKRGPASNVAKYARPVGPHGHWYYGRGHPQLTFYDNYVASSKDAGVDLAKDPDAMLDPVISSRVLIRGLLDGRWNKHGHGIGHYLHRDKPDLKNARRTVNVLDKWEEFAGFYANFLAAIDAAGGVQSDKPASVIPHENVTGQTLDAHSTPTRQDDVHGLTGIIKAILAAIAAFFRRKPNAN